MKTPRQYDKTMGQFLTLGQQLLTLLSKKPTPIEEIKTMMDNITQENLMQVVSRINGKTKGTIKIHKQNNKIVAFSLTDQGYNMAINAWFGQTY